MTLVIEIKASRTNGMDVFEIRVNSTLLSVHLSEAGAQAKAKRLELAWTTDKVFGAARARREKGLNYLNNLKAG